MALYEYTLYLVRESRSRSLLSQLQEAGLTEPIDDGEVRIVAGVRTFVDEFILDLPSGYNLQMTSLLIDEREFETQASLSFSGFLDWLRHVVEVGELTTLFMPGGPDASSFSQGDQLTELRNYLGALLIRGEVTVAHPLMYFRESSAAGALCARTPEREYYRLLRCEGQGCLLIFTDVRDDDSFEILESGSLQTEMLQALSND